MRATVQVLFVGQATVVVDAEPAMGLAVHRHCMVDPLELMCQKAMVQSAMTRWEHHLKCGGPALKMPELKLQVALSLQTPLSCL